MAADSVTQLIHGAVLHRGAVSLGGQLGWRLTCVVALHDSQSPGASEPIVGWDRRQVRRIGP